MRPTPRAVLFALSLSVASLHARPADADDLADEADVQFELGAKKYQSGDYLGALEHFLTSNRLVPNKNVLYNVARCYEQLHRYPDAYRAYVRALEAETAADRKKDLEIALARIAPKVAILEVVTDPPGATVYLDRKDLGPRGSTPRKLGLDKGRYKVLVELPGFEPAASSEVELEIGQTRTVKLALTPILATVNVAGDAVGASVRLDAADGPVLCTIPCAVKVPPGKHVLHVAKEGFKRAEVPIDPQPKQTLNVSPKLDVVTGVVVVNADVRDALIEVDGKPYGFTPAVIQVPVGKHVMTVSRSGFKAVTRPVEVREGDQARVDATLTEVSEVTAASRSEESIEDAPSSVSIVSGAELRGMGYPTIAEALRGVRGVYLSDDRHYSTVGFRGFSPPGDYGNRVLVLVDGHPINDNYVGSGFVGFDARTDLEDVERIEVVRGAGSVLYGTGAFFGVVNLVTRSRAMPTRVEGQVSAVEDGVARARASATVRFSPHAGVWTSFAAARGFGRDFFFPELAQPGGFDGWVRGRDSFDAGTISGRAWYKALTAQWSFHERTKMLPTGAYEAIPDSPDNRFMDRRSFLEVRFEPKIGESVQSFTRAHANLYDFRGVLSYAPADGGNETERFRGNWLGFEQRFAIDFGKQLRLTVGGEAIRHARAHLRVSDDAGTSLDEDHPYTVGAGYLLADYTPTPRFKTSAGARVDWYSTFGASLNPRLAFIGRPWQDGVAKLIVGKAFRAPSVYELFYSSSTQRASPNLGPENVLSGELELSHRFSTTLVGTLAGWANRVDNLVVLRGDPAAGTPVAYGNSDKPVLAYGVDAEVRRDFRDGWMIAGNFSVQKARYLSNDDGEYRKLPNSPELLGAVRGGIPIVPRALLLTSRVTYVGPRWDRFERNVATAEPQAQTVAAILWDFVFTGEAERTGIRWGVGVYNAFDWRWKAPVSAEFRQRSILQNGRTLYASLSVSF